MKGGMREEHAIKTNVIVLLLRFYPTFLFKNESLCTWNLKTYFCKDTWQGVLQQL